MAIIAGSHGTAMRPDLTTIPIEGVEPSHVVVACRADDRSRLVAAFRKIAGTHVDRADVISEVARRAPR